MKFKYRSALGVLVAVFMFIAMAVPAVGLYRPPEKPHLFYGQATVDDTTLTEGTVVSAMAYGQVIENTTVDSNGTYRLVIPSRYDSVTFFVRGVGTDVTKAVKPGEVTEQNLSISDASPPSLTITSPESGLMTGESSVTVKGKVSDDLSWISEMSVTVAGSSVDLAGDGSFSTTVSLETGSNTIEVIAEDLVGKTTSKSVEVTLDATAPAITVTSPEANDVSSSTVTLAGTVKDDVSSPGEISFTIGGESVELGDDGSFSKEVSLDEGGNAFNLKAGDELGNSSSKTVKIVSDTQAPNVTIENPAQGAVLGRDTVTVSGTVSDAVAFPDELSVALNGESIPLSEGSFGKEVSLSSGQNTIEVTVEDAVGNSASDDVTVTYDDTAPSITINAPEDGKTTESSEITVSGTVEDDVASPADIELSVAGSVTSVSSDGSFSTGVTLAEGSNDITVEATDTVGNSSSKTVTVERKAGTNWALWAGIIAVIAIILAAVAIWKQRRQEEA